MVIEALPRSPKWNVPRSDDPAELTRFIVGGLKSLSAKSDHRRRSRGSRHSAARHNKMQAAVSLLQHGWKKQGRRPDAVKGRRPKPTFSRTRSSAARYSSRYCGFDDPACGRPHHSGLGRHILPFVKKRGLPRRELTPDAGALTCQVSARFSGYSPQPNKAQTRRDKCDEKLNW